MMDFKPKVSIVIPVYNGSNYLREAIDSALAQTYRNIEVIVVNDGSNDEGKTCEIALSYGNKIRYFEKENAGVSTALNLGIREMRGQYFAWLSHDDIYHPQNIEIQMNVKRNTNNTEVSFTHTESFKGNALPRINYDSNYSCKTRMIHGAYNFFETWIYACALLIDKNCFYNIGLFDENLKAAQDVDITLRLLSRYNVVEIALPLTLRRDHQESGFHVMNSYVKKENNDLLFSLLNNKGIQFFSPNCHNNKDAAKAYNKLGNYRVDHCYDFSLLCYKKSKSVWPSIFNPAVYMLKLNRKTVRCFLRIHQTATRVCKWR